MVTNRTRPRHHRPLVAVLGTLVVLLLAPLPAVSQDVDRPAFDEYGIQGEGPARLRYRDAREGTRAPTPGQQAAADALGATVRWNDFGTPRVVLNDGDYLSGPVEGYDAEAEGAAVAVAHDFVRDHADLIGLSAAQIADLQVLRDSPLYDSPDLARVYRAGLPPRNPDVAHVVQFAQTFDGPEGRLDAANDGRLVVGVHRDGRVAWASSSVTRDEVVQGSQQRSATEALAAAALDVRMDVGQLTAQGQEGRYLTFASDTLSELQRARLVALPTPTDGVRLAWEVILLETALNEYGNPDAYVSFVDAETGEVLVRTNRLDHAAAGVGLGSSATLPLAQVDGEQPPEPFTGTTGGCRVPGPEHMTEVGEGVGTLNVFAQAIPGATGGDDAVDGDLILELYFQTTASDPVAIVDSLEESPELIRYSPAGGVPPGTYIALVRNFRVGAECNPPADDPESPPIDYTGFFQASSQEQGDTFPQPEWRVFPANPNFVDSPGAGEDTRVLWCWLGGSSGPECDEEQFNLAARSAWDIRPDLSGQSTFTTDGNYASTAISEANFRSPDTPQNRPVALDRSYDFDWTDNWSQSKCDPRTFGVATGGVDPDAGAPAAVDSNDESAATTNLFVGHNRVHDWSYFLGLTEVNGALQQDNFGNTAPDRENDPEIGSAQGGRRIFATGRDNANQVTLPDGLPGITNQYLWEPLAGAFYGFCADGAYDQAIIVHEYGHAVANRMTDPIGGSHGPTPAQTESWPDLMFAEYFRGFGISAGEGANPFALAPYVTGSPDKGIRNYAMNDSPLNYSNLDYDGFGPLSLSTHSNGEIWSATHFDIAQRFNEEYDDEFPSDDAELQENCARGRLAAQACPGNRRWIQLFFDAFLLQGQGPTMIDSRDAMLAADLLRFDGQNQEALWDAYARRGLGIGASADGNDDVNGPPSWENPLRDNHAEVTFQGTDTAGEPLEAEVSIHVGDYEDEAVPYAVTDPADGASETVLFVPQTYDFIATAPGYGAFRFSADLASGPQTIEVPMRMNHASGTQGATITGDGEGLENLIDDTESTQWESLEEGEFQDQEGRQVEGVQVTVELAERQEVRDAQVSASLRSGNRFSALRSFDLLVCDATTGADCASDDAYRPIYEGPAVELVPEEEGPVNPEDPEEPGEPEEPDVERDAADDTDPIFDAARPRPLVSNLNLRTVPVDAASATHVRLFVLDNQCTGTPEYQGEMNEVNSPGFDPDCDTLNPNDSGANSGFNIDRAVLAPPALAVRFSEFQVFSEPAPVVQPDVPETPESETPDVPDAPETPESETPDVPATPDPDAPTSVERLFGTGRIETAIELSRAAFEEADAAVLARADQFPDALAAATLAAEVEGPVLLTSVTDLDMAVAGELERLGVERVYLAGGPEALSERVESDVAAAGIEPRRLAGIDRFETAGLIGREVVSLGGPVTQAVVARADTFPDALAAGNVATYGRAPILLTGTGTLDATTAAFLDELLPSPGRVFVAGGNAAVGEAAANAVAALGHDVQRRAGAERYATAAELAQEGGVQGASTETLMLASGINFPDALTAAPVIHELGGTLLLVDPLDIEDSAATATFVSQEAGDVARILIAGGNQAVSDDVEGQIGRLVGIE